MSQTETDETGVTDAAPPSADSTTSDVSSAGPSPADTGPEPSITDAVLKALETSEDSPASDQKPGTEAAEAAGDPPKDGETTGETDGDSTEGEGEDDEHRLSPEEEAALRPKTKQRIDFLLDQRRELRGEVDTLRKENEDLKPQAESYRKVTEFMRANEITGQEASESLRIAGLMKRDPQAAFEALKPVMQQLATQIGVLLPQDLAEDVRLGRITQQRAQELSQQRAQNAMAQGQVQRQRAAEQERAKQERERRETEQRQSHVRSLASIGDELAAARAQSDPDWKTKEPLVVDKLKLDIAQNGVPKDRADLQKRFDRIVGDVSAYLKGVAGAAPRPTAKPASSASSPGLDTRPPPKDAQEAVLRALGE